MTVHPIHIVDNKPTIHSYTSLEHANPKNLDWIVVNWCVGNSCNYECSYCPSGLHDGSKQWIDVNIVKQFCERIIKNHPTKKVYFEFTGGEITVWKHFLEVCDFVVANGAHIGFISNGSRTIRWWENAIGKFHHTCLSFHPEFADKTHFMEVVTLVSKHHQVHVNVMMSPEKFDYCLDVAHSLKQIDNISIALQPLIVDFGDQLFSYTTEQQNVFENQYELIGKHVRFTKAYTPFYVRGAMKQVGLVHSRQTVMPHTLISARQNNWLGWNCYAGVEQIVVDIDGGVFRGWCKVGGKIGTVYDNNFTTPTEPILCNKNMCHCNFDIMSTKRSS